MATITVKSNHLSVLRAFKAGINFVNDSSIEIIKTDYAAGEIIMEDEDSDEDETILLDCLEG